LRKLSAPREWLYKETSGKEGKEEKDYSLRRKRECVIFRSLKGTSLENEYEPEIYGIPQLQSIEEETSSLLPQKRTKVVCMVYCIPTVLQS